MKLTVKSIDWYTVKILSKIIIFFSVFAACQPTEVVTILVITTDNVDYVEEESYRITGTVVSMGEDEITQHGFCWSESESPDTDGPSVKLGPCGSPGIFHSTISGFSHSATYFVRAYAVVNSMPLYGDEISFTTDSGLQNKITDIDGNIYKTVKIGNQIWMAENLKVTRYEDNTKIPLVEEQKVWFDFIRESKGYCWYENVLTNGYVYGALYTWPAAMGGGRRQRLNSKRNSRGLPRWMALAQ